jgi:hypothetical protein
MKNKVNSIRNKLGALAVIASAFGSTGVQASLADGIVDQWTVGVVGNFLCGTAVFTGAGGNNSCNNTTMNWGTNGISGLDLGNTPPATVDTNGAPVGNLSLTHRNQPINAPTLNSVSLKSTLLLTPLTPPDAPFGPFSLDFFIDFQETPNGANPCADGGANNVPGVNINGCGDIFVIDRSSLNFPFFYNLETGQAGAGAGEHQYFISFFEELGGTGPLSNEACAAVGVPNGCLGFVTPESANTTFNFAAVITTERIGVPVPGTLASIGLGLLLLGLRRR